VDAIRPFFDSMVVLVMILFFVPGLAFGIAAGTIRSDRDVARMTGDTMSTMGTYLVLAFVAGQFVAYFAWSNLGAIVAITGANTLKAAGLGGAPLLVALVAFSASLDIVLTSASAKWAVLAPIFVPMFVLLGYTPEATQAVYRAAESPTNVISPLMAYMPFVLAYVRRYDPRAGLGTVITTMLPYSILFLVAWTLLLLAFDAFHWPIGPGVFMRLSH
jgi:aminobenzoyl-glutamate transport protein